MTRIISMAIVALALSAAGAADAQQYPTKPVRIIVPLTAGGGVDMLARLVGQHYNAVWRQPFVIDNRPGAGGSIGVELAAKAVPDGYTLLVSSSSLVTNAAVQEVRYDPVRDFQPVSKLSSNPYIVVVTPALPVASVRELVQLAKTRPGTLTYASSGTGSVLHLGAELLCVMAGASMTHVPYKGVADGYPAVVSGQVNWMLGSPISALPLIKAGRLKALAVTTATRSRLLPDLPAIAESVPGYEVSAWFGLFAPARVPRPIVERLAHEAHVALQAPDVVRRMELDGTDAVGNTPAQFTDEVKREMSKWSELVRAAHLRAQ
ncbi:MAG TPA: tripartite tricarboxylate transporter substrate binding protein [Burkholderiales bacterium]|nr:tripartite tricarboxylate transporter substrate binding protein [Burkholderiales bacterium]